MRIELAMITTNLTHGRPYRLPFADNATFWFDTREIRKLFPRRIAEYLEREGAARLASEHGDLKRIAADNAEHFLPLPVGDKLPVVFGVRLSLSFPVLLGAVPLYGVDWTSVLHPDLETCEQLETESSRPTANLPKRGRVQTIVADRKPIRVLSAAVPFERPSAALEFRVSPVTA